MEQPQILVNMTDYPALRDAKKMVPMRLQADRYQLVIRKYDPQNGKPSDPDVLPLNRAGVQALADGIDKNIEQLQAQIASLTTAKANLLGALIADMDALDAAAKAAGDI